MRLHSPSTTNFTRWGDAQRSFIHSSRRENVLVVGGGPVGSIFAYLCQKIFSVPVRVIERQMRPTNHPQAHFISLRTMEILYSLLPEFHYRVRKLAAPVLMWKDYVYCSKVQKLHVFATIDQIPTSHMSTSRRKNVSNMLSPTQFVHFPQNQFEQLLSDVLRENQVIVERGVELVDLTPSNSPELLPQVKLRHLSRVGTTREYEHYTPDYVIGADGAHSLVRKLSNIDLLGAKNLQSLVNIHFTCPKLAQYAQHNVPAMLYFIFNPEVIGVLIAHDYGKGEFVLQVPFFPPHESIELDFTRQKCFYKIKSFLPNDMKFLPEDLSIHSIGQWLMAARIAESFHDKSRRVILMGDAAHQFPPAGGFGMNTGIQDAHNLAWKLGYIMQGEAGKIGSTREEILDSYQQERMCIANMTLKLSIRNVDRTMRVPSALQLSHKSAKNLTHFLNSPTLNQLLPNSMRRGILKNLMAIGTLPLHLASVKNNLVGQLLQAEARKIVESRQSLAMLFYHFDIGYSYRTTYWFERARTLMEDKVLNYSSFYTLNNTAERSSEQHIYRPLFEIGMRFPHIWLSKKSLNGEISILSSLSLYWDIIHKPRAEILHEASEKQLLPFLLILNEDLILSHITQSLKSKIEHIDVISIKTGEAKDQPECETFFAKENDILWNEFRRSSLAILIRPDGHIGHIWPLPSETLTLDEVKIAICSSIKMAST